MVKLHNAIVADIAVGGSLGSEDHASLAEFESIQLVLVVIHKENALVLVTDVHVLAVDEALTGQVEHLNCNKLNISTHLSWNDSRFRG